MSFYSWCQKIKYLLKAKSRHGVHSPFVYDFIEQVLLQRRGDVVAHRVPSGLNDRQQSLLQAIGAHYHIREQMQLNKQLLLNSAGRGILYFAASPEGLTGQFAENDIVVMLDIYQSPGQTKAWQELMENKVVPLSIDVFEMGILFFKRDFKVKQHFILKYR